MTRKRDRIAIPPFEPPTGQIKLQKRIEDRLIRLIEESPLKQEYRAIVETYPGDSHSLLHSQEVIDWLRQKRPEIDALLKQVCSEVGLPDTSVDMLERYYFLTDSGLAWLDTAPYQVAVRVDDSSSTRVHGGGPWLPPGVLTHDLDFVVKGNLETFRSDSWEEIGKHIRKWKAEVEAGHLYGQIPGRPEGSSSLDAEKIAVEMCEIYENVKRDQESKGRKRKQRRHGRSRYYSIYDEVASNYEGKYRREPRSLSRDTVKRLVQRGKEIMQASQG